MDNRIITASFTHGETSIMVSPVYQYNYGQELHFVGLDLPQSFEVHFSNYQYGTSTTSIGTNNVVTIPDAYFASDSDGIFAWVFLHDTENDGETRYEVIIPLRARAEITDETPTPEQQSEITQAIAALQVAVSSCEDAVADCEASVANYPNIGDNGDWYTYDAETDQMVDTGIHAQGEQGEQGEKGADGKDGKDGQDGRDGQDGADGADGYSPLATVSKSGSTATISITDKNGTTTAEVSDGDPTTIIDDNSTALNKVWSADKLNSLLIADISNVTFGGA